MKRSIGFNVKKRQLKLKKKLRGRGMMIIIFHAENSFVRLSQRRLIVYDSIFEGLINIILFISRSAVIIRNFNI